MAKFRSRSNARRRAFQVLYSLHFTPVKSIEKLKDVFDQYPEDPEENPKLSADTSAEFSDFAWELVSGVWSKTENLDKSITALSHHWRIDRLGKVELTVLRIALYELEAHADVPSKVIMSEALDLVSHFTNVQARHFIQSILETAIQQSHRPA